MENNTNQPSGESIERKNKIISDVVDQLQKEGGHKPLLNAEQECIARAMRVNQQVNQQYKQRMLLAGGLASQTFKEEAIQELYLAAFRDWSKDDLRFLCACLHTQQAIQLIS